MEIPGSTAAVAAIVAIVVPGLVYAGTRASVTGYRGTDKSLNARLVEAITISVVLNAAYLAAFGRLAYDPFGFAGAGEQVTVADPTGAGRSVLVFGLLLPAIAAVLVHGVPWATLRPIIWLAAKWPRFDPVRVTRMPTAWDFMGRTRGEGFVRVTRADGTVLGGWYGKGSFMSGYPEARDVYVAEQWALSEEGEFLDRLPRTGGVWISIRDDDMIEWLEREQETST